MLKRFVGVAVLVVGLVASGSGVRGQGGLPPVPADGQAYFGFTQMLWDTTDPEWGDARPFADRWADMLATETANKTPSLYAIPTTWQKDDGTFVPFSNQQWILNRVAAVAPNAVPLISWNAQTGWDVTSAGYSGITTKTINSGSLDAYITSYAQAVKAYGKPLFIRPICGEVNGHWWKHCSPNANPSLTKTDYINAFRRVVDIFNGNGVTNVAWVWNLNTYPGKKGGWGIDGNIGSYYPGDAYATWASVDHYDYGPASWLDPHVTFAAQHRKPLYIAEWGVRHPGSSMTPVQQQTWLSAMFNYFDQHNRIKAVQYFNYNSSAADGTGGHTFIYGGLVNYAPGVNDADSRLLAESGAAFRATFASRIASGRYR